MTRKNIHHHFLPHTHENGEQHHPHLASRLSLFIYLQLFIVFAGGIYLIQLAAPAILGEASFGAAQIINLTNEKREENGLATLRFNAQLATAAAAKAENMHAEDYWAHNCPCGKTPWNFLSSAGYKYLYAGENLARDFGDAGSIVNAWMESPSHRNNLLDENFTEIGVDVSSGNLTGKEGVLVVQMFGTQVSQIPTEENLVQVTVSPSPVNVESTGQGEEAEAGELEVAPSEVGSSKTQVAQAVDNLPQGEARVLASNKFALSKIAAMILVGFVLALFVLEILVVLRKNHLKLRPALVAHFLMLAFVMFALWYSLGGAIL